MEIPKEWKEQLPKQDTSIPTLLQWSLPRQGSGGFPEELTISALFSEQGSGDEYNILDEIPPKSYIQRLRNWAEDAQNLGYHSVKGGIPGTTTGCLYPLWMIEYWGTMSLAIASKEMWADSMAWLSKSRSYPPVVDKCIKCLPWMKPLYSQLEFRVDDLSILLSDKWLSDEHINFFAHYFNQAADGISPPILIAPLCLSNYILSSRKYKPNVSLLS